MKKILLTFAVAATTLAASAYSLSTPEFFSENFREMAGHSDYPTDGWLTLGNGAKPVGNALYYYNADGEGPYYVIMDVGSQSIPMANTDFEGGVEADEWMISPEIEMPYDCSSLFFKAYTYTAEGGLGDPINGDPRHGFKIMVSEGGTEREDFTEVLATSVRNAGTANFESKDMIASINGYAGKKIRVAFVVNGKMQGMTGFSDLRWGQYYFNIDANLTKDLAEVGVPVTVDYNTKIKSPVPCPQLKAQLYMNDELIKEEDFRKAFYSATSTGAVIQRLKYENIYTPTDDNQLTYRLVLTPDFEGSVPTEITGSFGFSKRMYKSNVVVEELTGTGCGYCPRGTASLEYYADAYPGTETLGKAINIAVHSASLNDDPMAPGNERYCTSLMELSGSTGLPGALMNRATRGIDPCNVGKFEELINLQSHNEATITKVEMPMGDAYEMAGETATVTFEVRNGFDAVTRNLSAAVVLIENGVTGSNQNYNQSNYFNTYNNGLEVVSACSSIGATDVLAPYLDPFCGRGEFANDPVPFAKMVYNHVSRGIFPSYSGTKIAEQWEADVPQTFTIDFQLPNTVQKLENTEIVVMVINNDDRKIVASDIFPAINYTDTSAVEAVESNEAIIVRNAGGMLEVKAADGALVEVYALDGSKLAEYAAAGGNLNVAAPCKGLMVVKVTSDENVKTAKLIF